MMQALNSGTHLRDRGSGTVLLLGIVAVVLIIASFLVALGVTASARGTAQSAADLGAIAAATAVRDGFDPCLMAGQVVEHNGARMESCELGEGGTARVTVTRSVPLLPGWMASNARARARAGPQPGWSG
ncbi:MAG: flp pilus-assembly TadE/G-like family protein [Cellulomonadaceae bacterium]|jgi:secretion/DNA translocation related TadE-like protein|nr:flp pilus-assembly TadE/G-like family protein [Cellulomonadaceae bacterium]